MLYSDAGRLIARSLSLYSEASTLNVRSPAAGKSRRHCALPGRASFYVKSLAISISYDPRLPATPVFFIYTQPGAVMWLCWRRVWIRPRCGARAWDSSESVTLSRIVSGSDSAPLSLSAVCSEQRLQRRRIFSLFLIGRSIFVFRKWAMNFSFLVF